MGKPNSVKLIFPFIRFDPAKFGCSVYTTWANDEGPKNLGVLNCVIRPLGREGIDPKSYLYHVEFGRYGSNFVGMCRGSRKIWKRWYRGAHLLDWDLAEPFRRK